MSSDFRNLRILFIGSVKEGRECLLELLALGCSVVGIITFDEEQAARTSGAVRFDDLAEEHGIPLLKVKTTNNLSSMHFITGQKPDVIFCIGWTRLLPSEILTLPRYGCIGMHASLLPKYRGRAPVNWVLINGEQRTGNSTILLDEGVDTGKVLAQRAIDITLADTCETLYDKVAAAGRSMLGEILPKIASSTLETITQDETEASVMPKRTPEDGIIDWKKSAMELFNWVRALTHPYPGAFTLWGSKKLFVWEARIAHYPQGMNGNTEKLPAGAIVSVGDGIVVATGDSGLLSLHRLGLESEPEQDWREFVATHRLQAGELLGEQYSAAENNSRKAA